MAITTDAKERTLDKLNQVLANAEVLIGESTFDGSGLVATGFVENKSISFTRSATVLSLDSTPESIVVPSGATYEIDRAYYINGFADVGVTDKIIFQSLGLSALADTVFTVGGNFLINSFTVSITEV